MGREGAVEATASPVLIVEGVGAGRQRLAEVADLVVWVQSDVDQAFVRGIDRDLREGDIKQRAEAEQFWYEWMASEDPFLKADRPWERAQLLVYGTPPESTDGTTYIAPGLLTNKTR